MAGSIRDTVRRTGHLLNVLVVLFGPFRPVMIEG